MREARMVHSWDCLGDIASVGLCGAMRVSRVVAAIDCTYNSGLVGSSHSTFLS